MSYSVLESSCCYNTIARTSNKKFLPIYKPVYKKRYNCMLKYTEVSDTNYTIINKNNNCHPETIKSFSDQIYNTRVQTDTPNKCCSC
jgi:hypothetical protein